jgi:hypothetical protein
VLAAFWASHVGRVIDCAEPVHRRWPAGRSTVGRVAVLRLGAGSGQEGQRLGVLNPHHGEVAMIESRDIGEP